ncbi:hypothetical protein [Polaribacter sp. Hel1_85]|uniref:hypothetical protein n=1 Tax=Polaribacter sp. Hel1_85 TaxID=1250005 RepID=UPI00052BB99D|nr:hypothetical protein [Polaribacter sp. Hel1_85]KGL63934.1 hypothetical protein PHEL85_0976 [Polaribacter sp. Hel1_85]
MYKKKKYLVKTKQLLLWLKRKTLLIITAFMLGFSNSINEEDTSTFGNHYHIEQQDKRD